MTKYPSLFDSRMLTARANAQAADNEQFEKMRTMLSQDPKMQVVMQGVIDATKAPDDGQKEKKEKEAPDMTQSSCGRYCWRDEGMVCVVEIECPAGTKAKDVSCTIGKNSIVAAVAGIM